MLTMSTPLENFFKRNLSTNIKYNNHSYKAGFDLSIYGILSGLFLLFGIEPVLPPQASKNTHYHQACSYRPLS